MDVITLIFTVIIFVISVSLHEYAHAWVSYKLWDPTPKIEWRLTPNPLKHIDPLWLLCAFILRFGRWRPVNVNPSYYKHQVRDELYVALAWPATNIVLALIWIAISLLYSVLAGYSHVVIGSYISQDLVLFFWIQFSLLNIVLAVFNMIPLPPLDWFRLVKMFFPWLAFRMIKRSRHIWIWFLILFVALPLVWIPYFQQALWWYIRWISSRIFDVMYGLLSHIVY